MDLDQPYPPPAHDTTQRGEIVTSPTLRRMTTPEDDAPPSRDRLPEMRTEPTQIYDLPPPTETLSGRSAALASQEPMTTPRTRIDRPPLMEDVPCQVCTGRDDEETMLLCDLCNHGYHIDCLEPALARVPRGPWLCPLCDQIVDAVPSRDIVDDEEVLDYLAADKRHRPGTSRKDASE